MTRPNIRPRTQTPRPPISNVRPLIPWKSTDPRSGSTRFASPPACWTAGAVGAAACAHSTGESAPIQRITHTATISARVELPLAINALLRRCLDSKIADTVRAVPGANAAWQGHAACQKDPYALFDRDVG